MHHSEVCRYSPSRADAILCGWVGVTSGPMAGEANNVHAFASPLPLSPPASGASFRFDARPGDFDIWPCSDDDRVPGRAVCGHGRACAAVVVDVLVRQRDPMARLREPAGPATVPTSVAVPAASARTAEPTTLDGYRRLATELADALASADERVAGALGDDDLFGMMLRSLVSHCRRRTHCEAGRALLVAGADGMLYPCRRFADAGAWPVGSVSEGVDEVRRDAYLSTGEVDDRTPCRDCWARYLCGGGCAFAAHAATGDHRTPDASDCEPICEPICGVAELGMWLLTEAWLRLSWGPDEGGKR